ncbi:MAG: amino acid adenylation domain-containing protein [Acidobacteriota bacterium]|nr:amino acid adenylation domain-containing protein [Acidobacteriota bacterium]
MSDELLDEPLDEAYEEDGEEAVDEIAVIGMAGRFPGAPDIETFWHNLINGVSGVRPLTEEELARVPEDVRNQPGFVAAGGYLDHPDHFDARFFDLIPREAQLMDPQQRLFLETCWETLERAGYNPESHGGRLGLFAGAGSSMYIHYLLRDPAMLADADPMSLAIASETDHLTPRTSYLFNLRGPSVPVQTACSTSLVAVHMACQSLITYGSDMALAGGVRATAPHANGYTYIKDSIMSPDGLCRAFDAQAAGTVPGNGVGVVLLKRLEDALEDGDHIHAVIRGSAINNDGSLKLGYTAPSVEGQTEVIREAQSVAGVSPDEITMIEAHGTGTQLGDPVEFTALKRAFSTDRRQFCALGALKASVGHMDAAAGIGGFIKAVLCLEHKTLVPSLHFENPNPQIDFAQSPFYVNTETKPWEAEKRYAGVSSFGIGGTNAHVILTEAPSPEEAEDALDPRSPHLITLSGKTETALENRHKQLLQWLEDHPDADPGDVAFTLNLGRKSMPRRRAFTFADREELLTRLQERGETTKVSDRTGVVFLFPGQGTDYTDLGRELYADEPVFAEWVDRCCEHLQPALGLNLADLMFAPEDSSEAARLKNPEYWQPALFTVEYAMARLWMHWGVVPEAAMGHSVGEYVAAVLSGVLNLEEGLDLIARRGRGTAALPRGAMLAVVMEEENLLPLLSEPLALAAVNGPRVCVVSGPTEAVDAFAAQMSRDGVRTKRLDASHAFHSSMMEPLMPALDQIAAGFKPAAPRLPIVSNVSGAWLTADEVQETGYWSRHLRGTVRFYDGLKVLMDQPGRVFLEVGPGKVLAGLVRNFDPDGTAARPAFALGDAPDTRSLLNTLGGLWREGVKVDWITVYEDRRRQRLVLPTYPWEHQSYWYDETAESGDLLSAPQAATSPTTEVKLDPADWFFIPTWRAAPLTADPVVLKDRRFLIFLDTDGLLQATANRLEDLGAEVIRVRQDNGFSRDDGFTANPVSAYDTVRLLNELKAENRIPDHVVYGFAAYDGAPEEMIARCFTNLALLMTTLSESDPERSFRVDLVTRGMQRVAGEAQTHPMQALITGPVMTAPLECPNLRCRALDLEAGPFRPIQAETLLHELAADDDHDLIARRGRSRWTTSHESLPTRKDDVPSPYVEGGTYVLLNGWREIAQTLAQTLILEADANVVILDRAFFPAREDWDAWLVDEGPEDTTSRRIEWVRALEELGAELSLYSLDPGDPQRLRRTLTEVRDRHGEIHMVLLFDQPAEVNPIQFYKPDYHSQIASGTIREAPALRQCEDLFQRAVVFAENPAEGLLGRTEARALYAWTARFVEDWAESGKEVTVVEWGTRAWRETRVDSDEINAWLADVRERFGMTPAECLYALNHALAMDHPRLIVSTREYGPLLQEARNFQLDRLLAPEGEAEAVSAERVRPEMDVAFTAPRNETESRIADVWRDFFGYNKIGVDDNFFELGGHSLMATRVVSRIRDLFEVEITVETLFGAPTVADLALIVEQAAGAGGGRDLPPIQPMNYEGNPPLSFAQQRLWFLDRFLEDADARSAYNILFPFDIEGTLSTLDLVRALTEVVHRHDSLRTTFTMEGEEPVQVIRPFSSYRVPLIDLSSLDQEPRMQTAQYLSAQQSRVPFDLERGPLFRFFLIKLEDHRHQLLTSVHHTIGDGWSLGVLINEVSRLYNAFSRGESSPLPDLAVQYTDYTLWQRSWEDGPYMQAHLDYWNRQLDGIPPLLHLPTDGPRGAAPTFHGSQTRFHISPETSRKIESLVRRSGATLFMTLKGILSALFARYSGQEDIVLGSPIANRNYRETEPLIGFFVNTLVLRNDLSGDPTVLELLKRCRETALEAYAHQDVPFEYVVEKVQPERNLTQSPLFQVMFALQNAPADAEVNTELVIKPVRQEVVSAIFDMTWNFYELGEQGMVCSIDFNTDLYLEETIQRLGRHFNILAAAMADHPEQSLTGFELLTPEENTRILADWNETEAPESAQAHVRFAGLAEARPEATALLYDPLGNGDAQVVSFGELWQRAAAVAAGLIERGIGAEDCVAVAADRHPDTVAAILGILTAGAVYLPIDPGYPQARRENMLADSGAALLLYPGDRQPEPGDKHLAVADLMNNGRVLDAETFDPDHAAYMIFTSGTTGRPKGAVLHHRGLANLTQAQIELFDLDENSRALQFASMSFDASISEVFTTLCAGAALYLTSREAMMPGADLSRVLQAGGITHVTLPPSALAMLDYPEEHPDLRTLVVAGEACPGDLVARWAPGRRFINAYGPTEGTVCATAKICTGDEVVPPIGGPIANSLAYVLDHAMNPVPVGVPGELFIGGIGLARGYRNRPGLTAERFVPNPFGSEAGARLYRSGDRVRYLPAEGMADIAFLGRTDHQIKLRGFRIELAEIEAVLSASPLISQALVTARPTAAGESRLVAYVVTDRTEDLTAELRNHLAAQLPEYMVPADFVQLERFPLTPNGKIDRKALPQPGRRIDEAHYQAPRTETEQALARIWGELLEQEKVGPADHFFDLGGHSLLATRLVSRLRDELDIEVPLREIFSAPQLGEQAALLDRISAGDTAVKQPPLLPRAADAEAVLSFAQQRMWVLDRLEGAVEDRELTAYNMPANLQFRGDLSVAAMEAALGEVLRRHEAARTVFPLEGGKPLPVLEPFTGLDLPVIDLAGLDATTREAALKQLAVHISGGPFDVGRGPLYRMALFRLGPDHHALSAVMHHIISDGWSMGILTNEMAVLYRHAAGGDRNETLSAHLPALPIQYADYASWQRGWLHGETLDVQLNYWQETLAGIPELLTLPTDRPRPPLQSHRGAMIGLSVPAPVVAGLEALAGRSGATLFMTLEAAFALLLGRYANSNDVCVGTPIAGRNHAALENLIGFFVNTLVIRNQLEADESFLHMLERTRKACLGAFAHQDVPFEQIVEATQPERAVNHAPLFQVMFALQNTPGGHLDLPGITLEGLDADAASAKFDMTLNLTQVQDRLHGHLEYATDLFDTTTIERFLKHFQALLVEITTHPERSLLELEFLDSAERELLVHTWNRTEVPLEGPNRIHGYVEIQAAEHPDSPAVIYDAFDGSEPHEITYRQLEQQANRLAHRLLDLGVGNDDLVGLYLDRSAEMVVGMLGVLEAGAAFLPLDPTNPPERLAYIVDDADMKLLIAHRHLGSDLIDRIDVPVIYTDEDLSNLPETNPKAPVHCDNLAYAIYTSGSTGRPKGSLIPHRGLINVGHETADFLDLKPTDRILQVSTFSFDASIKEIISGLYAGSALYLTRREVVLPGQDMIDFVAKWQINKSAIFPSMLPRLDPEDFPSLEGIWCGGEAMAPDAAGRWARKLKVVNSYGPTECTICTTRWVVEDNGRVPSLGHPIDNVTHYVLDSKMRLTPVGVPGELFIGGICVSRGYLNRRALTAERFVPDPFSTEPGARLYRSGDLVRHRGMGDVAELEFLGRMDHQVKLRGYRIELGEIESDLAEIDSVEHAVVVLRGDAPGGSALVAYVVPKGEDAPEPAEHEKQLREQLRTNLPDYMLPGFFVFLDAFPLNASGKVDRRALPAPKRDIDKASFVAPATDTERQIAEIWQEVLELETIGAQENFFEIGGQSLLLVQLHQRLEEVLERKIPLVKLLANPTVAAQAELLAPQPKRPVEEDVDSGALRREAAQKKRKQRRKRRGMDD